MKRGTVISRVSALALLILVILGLVFATILPLIRTQMTFQRQRADKHDAIIRYLKEEQKLKKLTAVPADGPAEIRLQSAPSETAAAGLLQQIVRRSFDANAISMDRLQFQTAIQENGLLTISMDFLARGDLANLQKALHTIELEPPFVFVEQASIHRKIRPSPASTSLVSDRTLEADMTVTGYFLANETDRQADGLP